jgi:hypothetical protein
VQLGNCPFHPYAAKATDLVCAINHAFLTGFLNGLDATTVQASLTPRPGFCCVELAGSPGKLPAAVRSRAAASSASSVPGAGHDQEVSG